MTKLEDITVDCKTNFNKEEITTNLKENGICILKNYFEEATIAEFISESNLILQNYQNKRSYLKQENKEGCSDDERIFNVEKYSDKIRDLFANDPYLTSLAVSYNTNLNKKTLLNRLTYESGKTKNSGAGWHRDNHHCQFKVITYLTDVNKKNGCFRFLTNSNVKNVGYPKPRKNGYANTRFDDETVENLVSRNSKCKILDVIGEKGTTVVVDTTYIHRGKIIEEGERLALTQYYFT